VRSTPTPKRKLADRERAASALALDLQHHSLEYLGAAPGALHYLKVDLDAVADPELRHLPQLTALDTLDQLVHR